MFFMWLILCGFVTLTSMPAAAAPEVTHLVIRDQRVEFGQVAAHTTVFPNRPDALTTYPAAWENRLLLKTYHADRHSTEAVYLSFTLTATADVLVVFDARVAPLPAWLTDGSWSETGDIVHTTRSAQRVFRKTFGPGNVVLGGARMAPVQRVWTNYFVVFQPTESMPADELVRNVRTQHTEYYQRNPLTEGAEIFRHHDAIFTSIPAFLRGATYFASFPGHKQAQVPDAVTLSLSDAATVLIAFDTRASALPTWLTEGSWQATNWLLSGSDHKDRQVYYQRVAAGDVVLGGASMPPATRITTNYTVVIAAADITIPQPLVQEVVAQSDQEYQVATISEGRPVYTDRYARVDRLPPELAGHVLIQTPYRDRQHSEADLLHIELSQAANVIVAYDANATNLPSWLNAVEWTSLGTTIDTRLGTTNLFQRHYNAGSLHLGGNQTLPATDARQNYFVIVAPYSGTAGEGTGATGGGSEPGGESDATGGEEGTGGEEDGEGSDDGAVDCTNQESGALHCRTPTSIRIRYPLRNELIEGMDTPVHGVLTPPSVRK
jgi:hypothetical protein